MTSALNLKLETPVPVLSDTWSVVLSKWHVTGLKSWVHVSIAGSWIHTSRPSTLLYPDLGKAKYRDAPPALHSHQTFLEKRGLLETQDFVKRKRSVQETTTKMKQLGSTFLCKRKTFFLFFFLVAAEVLQTVKAGRSLEDWILQELYLNEPELEWSSWMDLTYLQLNE